MSPWLLLAHFVEFMTLPLCLSPTPSLFSCSWRERRHFSHLGFLAQSDQFAFQATNRSANSNSNNSGSSAGILGAEQQFTTRRLDERVANQQFKLQSVIKAAQAVIPAIRNPSGNSRLGTSSNSQSRWQFAIQAIQVIRATPAIQKIRATPPIRNSSNSSNTSNWLNRIP